MDTTSIASIVGTAFDGLGDTLTTVAPGILVVGAIAFGVPMVWNWAKGLVR